MSGRIIEADHPQWTAWPPTVGRPDIGCDMLIGECACGTTHTVEQVAQAIVDHQICGDVEKATTHLLDIQRKQRAETEGAAQVQAREIARFAALVEQLKAERDTAQADAAAMREALTQVVNKIDRIPTNPKMFARQAAITLVMLRGECAGALSSNDAGRVLAERMTLLEAVARNAQPFRQMSAGLRNALVALDAKDGG